ncbi:uncharacterized protein MELLADRAFT_107633 [Melampsora larici-populina 98AG31]|uniref:Uncharacterized protein n=1 Tax=Melampsora larici-populina (strain 98AG31 / pathotype 3-4-7) TaxID=747676 RepID=F4RQ98_MELLP|nr:uncharacterized protein MELLADRAFT_107633 [Melampsora larici-populina 98AG31]EGG05368.1 hypothetical protein MELLADRAFT_107633 [Melampsora larici-populina 98AG31]
MYPRGWPTECNLLSLPNKPTVQFDAERNHLTYVARIDRPILPEWSPVQQHTSQFEQTTSAEAWVENVFHPDKFTISNYKKLKEIGAARRALIQKATLASQASYYPAGGVSDLKISWRRKIELETLFIQSLGERSDEVREIVQGFVDGLDTAAPHFLVFIDNFNSPTMNLGTNSDVAMFHLREQVQLPRRVRPTATPPGTSPPSHTQLDHETHQHPTTLADVQNVFFHDVFFREGDQFGHYSPDSHRKFVESSLLRRIQASH